MRRIPRCNFESIEDQFNFGKYRGLSLADVLDINPSYLDWCVKHCTGVVFRLGDNAIKEIRIVYPSFVMDALFESKRIWNLSRSCYETDDEDYYNSTEYNPNYREVPSYNRYSGSWVQDVEGYSDDDIDTIFEGDPNAYWNID